jgi:riboflavin kinase/FMN adenylyltransferase
MNTQPISAPALEALTSGNIRNARSILGYDYSIRGIVVHGNHLGRTLGFPTANIELDDQTTLLIGQGVYLVRVGCLDKIMNGIANIGLRPTIGGKSLTVEVNIFDFEEDIYGQNIAVWFLERIREERKFATLDDLVAQIRKDKFTALELLPGFQ